MRMFMAAAAIGGLMLSLVGTASAAEPKAQAPAIIHVALPASATLTFNGAKTDSTSAERSFVTPALDAGKSYVCTLKSEFVRDGVKVTVERKVTVRAGQETMVSMDAPITTNSIYRSLYNGSVPAPAPSTESAPTFFTPPMTVMPVIQERSYLASDGAG